MKPDDLFPIRENNKDEYFLIEYEGFIKNLTHLLIKSLEDTLEDHIDNIPHLKEFLQLSEEEKTHIILLSPSPEDFFSKLCGDIYSKDEQKDMIDSFLNRNYINDIPKTLFEKALQNIIDRDFCKKIVFVKKLPWKDYEMNYMIETFRNYIEKIDLISGNIFHYLTNYKPTMICINDEATLMNLLMHDNTLDLEKIVFILRNTCDNIQITEEGTWEEMLNDEIIDIVKDKIRYITRIYTTY